MLVSLVLALAFCFNLPFFLSPPPRHAGGSREVFDGGLLHCSVCVPFNYFSSRFSWLHSQDVQRCGDGFEEPHLRLMF